MGRHIEVTVLCCVIPYLVTSARSMWSRRLSESLRMNQKDFSRALLASLKEEEVEKILSTITGSVLSAEMMAIHQTLDQLRRDIRSEVSGKIEQLQSTVVALRQEISEKDATIATLKTKVAALEGVADEQEQYSRRNSLRLSGLPESPREDIVAETIRTINERMELDPPLVIDEIDRLHRVGQQKEGVNRAVLIKFATYRSRRRVFSEKKKLKVSTTGSAAPKLFLNEDLTRHRAELLWEARKMKLAGRIKDAWSADGRLLLKNNRGVIVPFKSIDDLQKIS